MKTQPISAAELKFRREMLRRTNRELGPTLVEIPKSEWPSVRAGSPDAVFRSRGIQVLVFHNGPGGIIRMTVHRTELNSDGGWKDGITWDDLQRLKREAGFGDREAVEIYPPDDSVVNVANMRHLWILAERMPFSWRDKTDE